MGRLVLVAAIALAAIGPRGAAAQGTGNGISKATYACNDPTSGHVWLQKYLGALDALDECSGDVCSCEATDTGEAWGVQQGRVELLQNSSNSVQLQFGLHLVNSTAHVTTGGHSVSHMESIVAGKLAGLESFDGWLDYSVTVFVAALDRKVAEFDDDGVDYLAFEFPDPTDTRSRHQQREHSRQG